MSNRCKCGFYNQLRHHTKISGGACEYYRIAELEATIAELELHNQNAQSLTGLLEMRVKKLEAENAKLRETARALLDDIGDTYDESSGYHRIQVWVDGDLIDALAALLESE